MNVVASEALRRHVKYNSAESRIACGKFRRVPAVRIETQRVQHLYLYFRTGPIRNRRPILPAKQFSECGVYFWI